MSYTDRPSEPQPVDPSIAALNQDAEDPLTVDDLLREAAEMDPSFAMAALQRANLLEEQRASVKYAFLGGISYVLARQRQTDESAALDKITVLKPDRNNLLK